MFTQLVESRPGASRVRTGTLFSFVVHWALILGVLFTSAEARSAPDRPRDEKIRFLQPKPVQEPELPPAPEPAVAPLPELPPVLTAPLEIPRVLPDIDLSRPPTDPGQFSGARRPEATSGGDDRALTESAPPPSHTYLESEVERPAAQAAGSAVPTYPDLLRRAGVEGEAVVSFVVDTLGRADPATFTVIRSTHQLFGSAVRTALPRMRFIPAETSYGKVRQLVQQRFSFAIAR